MKRFFFKKFACQSDLIYLFNTSCTFGADLMPEALSTCKPSGDAEKIREDRK